MEQDYYSNPKSVLYKLDTPIEKPCVVCQQPVQTTMPNIRHLCTKCTEDRDRKEAEEKEARALKQRQAEWAKICPLSFQKTNPEKLPRPLLLEKVLQWEYGPKGLILYGKTGLGKTRCCYKLLEREFFNHKRDVRVLDYFAVGMKLAGMFGESATDAADYVEAIFEADLLFLDDVFKGKLTDKIEEVIFTIIDQRLNSELPTVVTLNDVGETLLARMSQDRGPAMLRRLRESCDQIAFV